MTNKPLGIWVGVEFAPEEINSVIFALRLWQHEIRGEGFPIQEYNVAIRRGLLGESGIDHLIAKIDQCVTEGTND